jgi:eukaryotic-like serine/threonine-protein kinase
MPAPTVVSDFLECVRKSAVTDATRLQDFVERLDGQAPSTPARMADALVAEGLLTRFQADQLLRGRWRNFILCGKYIILEPLGAGGMGTVYLCSHKIMHRPVAIKVLPASQADDPGAVERFHREAQAVAQMRHPNIVGAHDVDRDGKFHFLVMEYIDGISLQELVKRHGPMEPIRAAHYIHQAVVGLQHAHEAGLVHRDIKPANLLVDRTGVVKVLDLGLARFFHDKTVSVTQKYDGNAVLGTADYLAPEQAVDSHNVDIRCDIYSLGITFYFLLAGHSPFEEGSVAEKLIWHQVRQPKPIRELRPDVPEGLAEILRKMIAKEPSARYQTPAELAEALAPWTQTPIDPPSVVEIPQVSAGARLAGVSEINYSTAPNISPTTPTPPPARPPSSGPRRKSALAAQSEDTKNGPPAHTSLIPTSPTTMKSPPAAFTTSGEMSVPAPAPDSAILIRRPNWLLWAGAALAALLLVGVGLGVGLVYLNSVPVNSPVDPRQPNGNPMAVIPPPVVIPPVVNPPVVNPPPDKSTLPETGVSIRPEADGFHVRTAAYEALVDTDGCLNSMRVGGVEFLKPGEPIAGNKSVAHGAYFYSEKEGNVGLVKLPHIERTGNVIVANGDKFSVRYEFGADAVLMRPSNNTDETVPFYLVLDSGVVTSVETDRHERLAVPVARKQTDPLDPALQTSTWIAGRSRLTITDGTKIWGPFGAANSQVWERSLPTYNAANIRLEPRIGPEEETQLPPGGVLITRSYTTRRIRTELYEAIVEGDGCLSSLRVDGVEFLHPGLNVSRGAYFLHAGPVRMVNILQPAPNVLAADGPDASARYEFGPDKLTWTLENKTGEAMPFYVVFDSAVMAGQMGDKEWLKTPGAKATIAEPLKDTTAWYAGRSRLALTGGNRLWGPWPTGIDRYQVWEATLAPHERRTVAVELGRASAEDVNQAAMTAGVKPVAESQVALYAPLDYQVFQRKTRLQGEVTVRGRVRADFDRVEVRLTGKPLEGPAPDKWQLLSTPAGTHEFTTTLPAPAGGWYRLELRATRDGKEVASGAVDHVGVGEVFIGAGQSNSTNCGELKTQQHSGMVASFSGTFWQLADDPQPGSHDDSMGGSFWPAFGDAMAQKYKVPIGVASTGHSGTSVNAWQPGGGLFEWTSARMNQLGREGFRAVLWHQGESDAQMPPDEYDQKMKNLIQGSRGASGCDAPWFVAQVSYHNPAEPMFPEVREAQKKLWESGLALQGPDTDTLTGGNRDNNGTGIHFSPMGLAAHGRMWADKVGVWLDKTLAK